MKTNTGGSADDAAIAEAIRHILGNTCRLVRTTQCCKWNARGPLAAAAALIFALQIEEMLRAEDELAERLLLVSAAAVSDDSEAVIVPRPQDHDYAALTVNDMVGLLAQGHDRALVSIAAGCDVAREYADHGSLHVLGVRLVAHQRHALRLSGWAG